MVRVSYICEREERPLLIKYYYVSVDLFCVHSIGCSPTVAVGPDLSRFDRINRLLGRQQKKLSGEFAVGAPPPKGGGTRRARGERTAPSLPSRATLPASTPSCTLSAARPAVSGAPTGVFSFRAVGAGGEDTIVFCEVSVFTRTPHDAEWSPPPHLCSSMFDACCISLKAISCKPSQTAGSRAPQEEMCLLREGRRPGPRVEHQANGGRHSNKLAGRGDSQVKGAAETTEHHHRRRCSPGSLLVASVDSIETHR